MTSETITIKKTYRLEDSVESDEQVLVLEGEGLITFNRELGVIQKSEFEGLLRFRRDGQDVSIPLKLDLLLEDPEEYARRQAQIEEEIARRRAEQKAAEEAWEKLPPDEKVDRLLNDIRNWKSNEEDAVSAVAKLARVEPIEKRRREVYDSLSPLLGSSVEKIVRVAIAPAVTWSSGKDLTDLTALIDSGNQRIRESAMDALCEIQDERVAASIAKRLELAADRYRARQSLERMGSIAEKPLLELLDHADAKVRSEACQVLGSIGGQESIPALEGLAENDPSTLVQLKAKSALWKLQSN